MVSSSSFHAKPKPTSTSLTEHSDLLLLRLRRNISSYDSIIFLPLAEIQVSILALCQVLRTRQIDLSRFGIHPSKCQMAPRWKGKDAKSKKDAEAEALKEPMSKIIAQLQSSLVQSNTCGFLSDNSVQLAVQAEQLDLLDKACFGRPVRNVEKDMYWFQLTLEEAFYLCYSLKCLKINGDANSEPSNEDELWHYFKSKKEAFPFFYKAYSHLRMKNWVVRSGAQYGVDFIVYRHHPARVHSEYGVLVLSQDNDDDQNGRLRVWSDVHCTTRLLGSVAKALLVLYIKKNGHSDESPLCLANYTIEERTISRWSPEQCRERSI